MAECYGVSLQCMLDSCTTHSFAQPQVVKSMRAKSSKRAVLTVTMANGNKVLYSNVCIFDLMFMVEGGNRQVTVHL